MNKTMITIIILVTSGKNTKAESHKSKGIQKGILLPLVPSPNIWVLYRAFHARADIEASHRVLGITDNKATPGLGPLRIKKILQGNGMQRGVAKV